MARHRRNSLARKLALVTLVSTSLTVTPGCLSGSYGGKGFNASVDWNQVTGAIGGIASAIGNVFTRGNPGAASGGPAIQQPGLVPTGGNPGGDPTSVQDPAGNDPGNDTTSGDPTSTGPDGDDPTAVPAETSTETAGGDGGATPVLPATDGDGGTNPPPPTDPGASADASRALEAAEAAFDASAEARRAAMEGYDRALEIARRGGLNGAQKIAARNGLDRAEAALLDSIMARSRAADALAGAATAAGDTDLAERMSRMAQSNRDSYDRYREVIFPRNREGLSI